MYLIDVKKLYFYGVSFVSLIALSFSLMGGVANLARYYWFKTGPMVSYQPPFISNWVPWNNLVINNYSNPLDPYTQRMEGDSMNIEELISSYEDLDQGTKDSLRSWVDSYESWKNEQINLKKSVDDNIITNLAAFVVFLPIFLFHLIMALKLDKRENEDHFSSDCACGGDCGDDCSCDGDNCTCALDAEDHHHSK